LQKGLNAGPLMIWDRDEAMRRFVVLGAFSGGFGAATFTTIP
jgi:hypothetical protein